MKNHKAKKKILRVPWSERNCNVWNTINLLVSSDFINLRSVKICYKTFQFTLLCFYYFKDNSFLFKHCASLMLNSYGVNNLNDNDIDALIY